MYLPGSLGNIHAAVSLVPALREAQMKPRIPFINVRVCQFHETITLTRSPEHAEESVRVVGLPRYAFTGPRFAGLMEREDTDVGPSNTSALIFGAVGFSRAGLPNDCTVRHQSPRRNQIKNIAGMNSHPLSARQNTR